MTKKELLEKVNADPTRANVTTVRLDCEGGFGSGSGYIEFDPYENKWVFQPLSRTGRSFYPTNEFVENVIWSHRKKLSIIYGDISAAAAALGRKGGSVKSKAKAKASAENGRKGGRPRKQPGN